VAPADPRGGARWTGCRRARRRPHERRDEAQQPDEVQPTRRQNRRARDICSSRARLRTRRSCHHCGRWSSTRRRLYGLSRRGIRGCRLGHAETAPEHVRAHQVVPPAVRAHLDDVDVELGSGRRHPGDLGPRLRLAGRPAQRVAVDVVHEAQPGLVTYRAGLGGRLAVMAGREAKVGVASQTSSSDMRPRATSVNRARVAARSR